MPGQSAALKEETGAMRAIEAALDRARKLDGKAAGRVLTWAVDVAQEALDGYHAQQRTGWGSAGGGIVVTPEGFIGGGGGSGGHAVASGAGSNATGGSGGSAGAG
jgi:hypothetical protein